MHLKINRYNQILGIKGKISEAELKTLYRIKAKALHPDRNPSLNSHEQFVLLHEAYEFYKQFLEDGLENEIDFQLFNSNKYPKHYQNENWKYYQSMEARRKAQRRAKMRYADFERNGYPQVVDRLFEAFDIFRIIFTVILIIVLPVFLYTQEGLTGILMALLIQFITLPIWSNSILRYL